MAWADVATQTGIKMGLLKPGETATGGLLQKRAEQSGRVGDLASMIKKANTTQGTPVKPLSVASFTEPQKTALTRMTEPSKAVNPLIGETVGNALSSTQRLNAAYDPNSYKQFMNPYLTDVVDTTANRIRRSFDDARTQAREQIGAAGAFGSTALGQMYGDIAEQEQRQIADTTANLMAGGFDTATGRALDLYGLGGQRALSQAGQYGNIAQQLQNLDQYGREIELGDIQRQLASGSAIQAQNQAVLDAYFAERERQLNEPVRQAEILRNALVSYPTGQSTTQVVGGNPYLSGLGGALLGSRLMGGTA